MLNAIKNRVSRGAIILLSALALFQLSACADPEPKQRSEFILFLQTEVINKVRVSLPPLTSEQVKSFGEYSKQYTLLTDFHSQLQTAFLPLEQAIQSIQAMSTVKELVDNRQNMVNALNVIKSATTELERIHAGTNEDHALLKQPEELKLVYDEAYKKVVTNEVNVARGALPLLSSLYTSAQALVDFVNSKNEDVAISSYAVEFSKQADVEKFNQINDEMQKNYQAYREFAQKNR